MQEYQNSEEKIKELEAKIEMLTIRLNGIGNPQKSDIQQLDFTTILEKLKYYREENAREWALLSNRVSSYITSQSFLITSYAICMGNQTLESDWFRLFFSLILVGVGIATSNRAEPGITGAKEIINSWRERHNALFRDLPEDHPIQSFRDTREIKNVTTTTTSGEKKETTTETIDKLHQRSLFFAEKAPLIFRTAWFWLGGLSIIVFIMSMAAYLGVKIP